MADPTVAAFSAQSARDQRRPCSGSSNVWLKSKKPASDAVRREREEEWR
jgi:hypothetical protein